MGSSGVLSPPPPNSERIWRAAFSISRNFFSPSRGRCPFAASFARLSASRSICAPLSRIFVLRLFALDLHALERVAHRFVLLFGGRVARALRPGGRGDEEQEDNGEQDS